ncbi:hypothetical protein PMZ80_007310 [Knufia obscura]|uniref:F-box domain-containing protein n=2 Tax=Knufia TaxID=430999 RepID=A0AAN8EL53_9EURO|nr:hypothetical protein PMZ80_007310 [Knufia obscura]KAK5953322.1 hypothetical protein OHC33_005890 [Knufia fluminis]
MPRKKTQRKKTTVAAPTKTYDLSTEILEMIFRHLPMPIHFIDYGSVCRNWFDILFGMWWKAIVDRDSHYTYSEQQKMRQYSDWLGKARLRGNASGSRLSIDILDGEGMAFGDVYL